MLAPLRTFLVGVLLCGFLLIMGPPALLLAWLTGWPELLYRLALPAARFGMWLAGVRIRVEGRRQLEKGRNYLFMPNHISNVDPPVVVAALRRYARLMAKASLFRIPVFGSIMSALGFVPVEREDRAAAIEAVGEAARKLRQGLDFVVFPEGTRSRDGKLLPLKKGPFFLALDGGVAVVPVRVSGTRDIMKKGGKVIHPGDVYVHVGAPIELDSLSGDEQDRREELMARVETALRGDLTATAARVTPDADD